MKDVTTPKNGWRGLARRWGGAAIFALLLGALVPGAQAQFSLKTLSGGPNTVNTNFDGYFDGPINQDGRGPQYDGPSGLTVVGGNSYLLIADRTNNAIRKVDLSVSTLNVSTVTRNGLSNPVDVQIDSSGRLYVLNQGTGPATGRVLMYDSVVFTNLIKTNISGLALPTAMALDSSTNLYITLSAGTVLKISNTATTTVATIAGAVLRGIVVRDDGKIAVTDAINHVVWLVDPTLPLGSNVSLLAGVPGSSGTAYGALGLAKFNQPHGIAKAGNGLLIVADRQNHRVSVVDTVGTVTNLYGIPSNQWVNLPNLGLYPGWADVPPANNRGEAREPVGVVVGGDGSVYATEAYYHLIRQANAGGITGPTGGTGGSGTNVVTVPPPTITPDSGYFPIGVTITVGSSVPDVFYTTDGTDPSTNSIRVVIDSNTGTILWNNPTNDLTKLKIRAFIGTNASIVVSGKPVTINVIGVPPTVNTNYFAGIGSRVAVPVIVSLSSNQLLRTLQFNAFVVATNGSGGLPFPVQVITITTNDFVRLPVPSSDGLPVPLSSDDSTDLDGFGNTRHRLAVYTTSSDNLQVSGSAAVAILDIPIPAGAVVGDTYILQIRNASGTSDGGETEVAFQQLPDQIITIANLSYLVGDTSPGRWYNAGDFGNTTTTNINNPDVNNAFLASVGIRTPYTFSDAFDAMDSFPQDTINSVGGDGILGILDWTIILDRSLRVPGQDGNNWYRAWSTGGVRVNTAGPVSLARSVNTIAPGNVWYRQAMLGGQTQSSKSPGATVTLPIYVKLATGASISGLQFRARVTASEGAPGLTSQMTFSPAGGIPTPAFRFTNAVNDIVRAWNIGTLNLTQPSNFVGNVQFTIPATAQVGDHYTLSFSYTDGAPDKTTLYTFETKSGTVWVGMAAPSPVDGLSDEWKIYFFGAVDSTEADATADPDGDGISNWEEYLAGTDPTSPESKLQLKVTSSGVEATLQWLSAPGKTYVVECTTSLADPAWTTVATVAGDGQYKQVTQSYAGSESRFYRVRVQP